MIKIKDISAGYLPEVKVLDEINCDIAEGSFCGIIGRNGAGKSTLLRILCGLMKPFSGKIIINGTDISRLSKKDLSKTLSFMPQNPDTELAFSVEEFVMFGRYPHMNIFKTPSGKDRAAVNEALEFTGTVLLAKRPVNELSGGEKQKVLMAQTIVQETGILVLDEPASHLDIGGQSDILNLLRTLNGRRGKTVIVTLHDLNAAGEFCDNLILLQDGKIRNSGKPECVLNREDIEEVYKTKVAVHKNPVSGKPYIIPVNKKDCL